MESAITKHEFEKARVHSDEERRERGNLKGLREKYKPYEHPALTVRPEEIERAVSKLLETPDALGSTDSRSSTFRGGYHSFLKPLKEDGPVYRQ